MRAIRIKCVMVSLFALVLWQAETEQQKPMTAADYFRQPAGASASTSSSSPASNTAGDQGVGAIYTSCKALRDQGALPSNISRDDLLQKARDAGCSQADIDGLAQVYDMLHGH